MKCMILGGKNDKIYFSIHNDILDQAQEIKFLGSIITEDLTCTTEVKTTIAMDKEAFNKERRLLWGKLNLGLEMNLQDVLFGVSCSTVQKYGDL